jgi:hypothetical protein
MEREIFPARTGPGHGRACFRALGPDYVVGKIILEIRLKIINLKPIL